MFQVGQLPGVASLVWIWTFRDPPLNQLFYANLGLHKSFSIKKIAVKLCTGLTKLVELNRAKGYVLFLVTVLECQFDPLSV